MIKIVEDRYKMDNLKFRSLEFENYKSFDKVNFDLMLTKKKVKNLAVIYGENGVGKSTVISAIKNLRQSLDTRINRINFEKFTNENFDSIEKYRNKFVLPPMSFGDIFKDVPTFDTENQTISKVKYNFCIDGKNGIYTLRFNNEQLLNEKLEFTVKKNRGILFDISSNSFKINSILLKNKTLKRKIFDLLDLYWGNHSFLSIINEMISQNDININIIPINLTKIIKCFSSICILDSKFKSFGSMVPSLLKGTVLDTKKTIESLNSAKDTIKYFLNKMNSNIQNAEYKFDHLENGNLNYELFLTERINGKLLKLSSSLASDGTKSTIELLPFLVNIMNGNVVAIDELDKDIHDLLLIRLVNEINNADINGQLIFSTHNTLIMDEINSKAIYCINSDINGKRTINTIDKFGRISDTSSISKLYREGRFYGIPYLGDFNISKLSQLFLKKGKGIK